MTREMHPQRWGDPDAAAALPEGARSRVAAVFGPAAPVEPTQGNLPAPVLPTEVLAALADAVGAANV
ncbi:MAG TPA: FAD-binding oxidoreductase, partial [Nocardioides sp.]|nr:FAD-binding oxidoreductase [Nocardioides sp.]